MRMNEQHEACETREKTKLYKIGMFANMNRVTIKTLRYYDEQNLLKPVYVDEENGYRYYAGGQIAELHRILALREMEKAGCVCEEPEYCFTQYLEQGYKENDILIETCQAVTEKKEDTDKIKFKVLPEVEAACIFHKGSYDTFHKSYGVILNYIEENGYEISGCIRESYIDGVWNKDKVEDWLSEIQIPVTRR